MGTKKPGGLSRAWRGQYLFLFFRNLPATRSAVACDVIEPTLAVEAGVLRSTEIGENCQLRRGERVACIGNVGKLRIMGTNRVGKCDKIFLSHY